MKQNHTEFDERQLQIRGKIFQHGFFLAILLIFLNSLLQDCGIVWAETFHEGVLMMMLLITVVSVEFQLRGAYFGKGTLPGMAALMVLMGLSSLSLLFLCCMHMAQGESLLSKGVLTGNGTSLILGIFVLTIPACAGVQLIREKRNT